MGFLLVNELLLVANPVLISLLDKVLLLNNLLLD